MASAEHPEVRVTHKTGFLIWTKHGNNPRVLHPTRERAEAEANRLAARFPGKAFFVVAMTTKHKAASPNFGVAALAEAA